MIQRKETTLSDVAKLAAVSPALVSYVLNGQAVEKRVSNATAEKILAAASQLNYRPNQIARSLKTNRTGTIGLIVADINYKFTTGITRAIEEYATATDLTVIFGSSNERVENLQKLIQTFLNHRVDGLLIVPVAGCEPQLELLTKTGIPFVLIDRYFPDTAADYVLLDNHSAGFEATQYLLKKGYRHIAMINYQTALVHLHDRNAGYLDALKSYGIDVKKELLQEVDGKDIDESVATAVAELLQLNTPCDAILFATDTLTCKGLKALSAMRVRVPDQIAVFSFDESESFELFYCTVSHVRQPLELMGQAALKLLLQKINHEPIKRPDVFRAKLIEGESS